MNIVDAFLTVTALSFFFGAVYPKSVTFFSKPVEKLGFLAQGTVLASALFVNNYWFWLILGVSWTPFIGLDFVEAIKYRVTKEAQVFMTVWDLLIAVSCLLKA